MQVVFQDSVQKVQQALADDLVSAIAARRDKKLLLFYSGGSALEVLPLALDGLKREGVAYIDGWFAPIDERFDVTASNFQAFSRLDCFRGFERMGIRYLDVLSHGHSLEDCAYWFSEWVRVETDEVHIDDGLVVSILGMGPDGHTAGLFPHPENEVFFEGEFINTQRFAHGYDVGDKNQYRERITVTVPALHKIDKNFAYVVGENKKEALSRVVNKEGSVAATPALVWQELNDVSVYTDISL